MPLQLNTETETESQVQAYTKSLWDQVREAYDIARKARSTGLDVTDQVEIPLASDMADRIEELIGIRGIASEIRQLAKVRTREEVSIEIARKVASLFVKEGKRIALEKAVRVGLAILTEGILVAPLEGIADLTIEESPNGTYASVVYSGPIRGAGGTAQALSVVIADIVRRDLGIGRYYATDDEVERYIEEIQSYNRLKHLQYLPSPEEIKTAVRNIPVCIDGEGSEEEEVSGHRDMPRVRTNRIRGGMCLVLCEGILQKAKKVIKYTNNLGMIEWKFLESIAEAKKDDSGHSKSSEKFLKDLVAGRPVFSHPGRPGGFRLRYGRSRVSGLAAASLHPVTMRILDSFVAIGSQIKVELPGKAAAVTPCDSIDPPMVLLRSGEHLRIRTMEMAEDVMEEIESITDVGEILISFGDFLENNQKLLPGSFCQEWWNKYLPEDLREAYGNSVPSEAEAIEMARKRGVPLHPEYDFFWHDMAPEEIMSLRETIVQSGTLSEDLELPEELSGILIRLGVEYRKRGSRIIPTYWRTLLECLGIQTVAGKFVAKNMAKVPSDSMELINMLSGMTIIPRSPTRIGARLGRPEKAGDRKMKPKVHVLFPVENFGDSRRSIKNASKNSGNGYEVEVLVRRCTSCKAEVSVPRCPKCGSNTVSTGQTRKINVNISEILESAQDYLGIKISEKAELKGVKKLMSRAKACEPMEKGILRAIHDVTINKDGTCRYDMSDIPITHFKPEEIGLDRERVTALGYPESDMLEIFPQDIIIPRKAADYLIRVSQYVDDLLEKYFGLPPFYRCSEEQDLIGHLVIGLAPHTSGGILGRIIGFSDVNGCYAHPFFHAAKRRNCDGDEDSIMLLMDGLINFSREFLPSTRGGLMDAPLVLTVQLNPEEVDKEAMNIDTLWEYPLEFYLKAQKHYPASDLEGMMATMGSRYRKNGTIMGSGFTNATSNINYGVLTCSYKTIGTMDEKIERQLGLARRIRAVDADDVAARVLNSHFLPDMYGNFRGFFSQEFRCTKCNTRYRRVPLSGRCRKCGNESIGLTIHKGSIVKYMDRTMKIAAEFNLPWYLNMRIENLVNTIKGTFALDGKNEDSDDGISLASFEEEEE
ncbi:MAG: DNA polymerase II large subunit [Thermoplasmataceae archaeon]